MHRYNGTLLSHVCNGTLLSKIMPRAVTWTETCSTVLAVTYSFLLYLVHPSQKASSSPQAVFPALCPICL